MASASEFVRLLKEGVAAPPAMTVLASDCCSSSESNRAEGIELTNSGHPPTAVGSRHFEPALQFAASQLPEHTTYRHEEFVTGTLGLERQEPSVQISIYSIPTPPNTTMLLDQFSSNDFDKAADTILAKVSVEFLDKAVARRIRHAIQAPYEANPSTHGSCCDGSCSSRTTAKNEGNDRTSNYAVSTKSPDTYHVHGNKTGFTEPSQTMQADFLRLNRLRGGTVFGISSSGDQYRPSTAKAPFFSPRFVSCGKMTYLSPDKLDTRPGDTMALPHYASNKSLTGLDILADVAEKLWTPVNVPWGRSGCPCSGGQLQHQNPKVQSAPISAAVTRYPMPAEQHKPRPVPTIDGKRRKISRHFPDINLLQPGRKQPLPNQNALSRKLTPVTISSQQSTGPALPGGRWVDDGLSDDKFSSDEDERSRPVKTRSKMNSRR